MRKVVNDYLNGELEVPLIDNKLVDISVFNVVFEALAEQYARANILDNLVKKYAELTTDQSQAIIDLNAIKTKEEVDHPKHYNHGSKETIEVIKEFMTEEAYFGFLLGNVIKYLDRANLKGGKTDFKKAEWYYHRYLQECPNPVFPTLDQFASSLSQKTS